MDNLKTHSEYADQPQGPQENALSFALPTGQVLDNHVTGQQHTDLSSFWFSLEQHRLKLDQVLQLQNEQLWVSLQQQISMPNATDLVKSATGDVLMQKHDEIGSLRIQLQKKQEDIEITVHERDEWMKGEALSMARTAVETTQPNLISKVCNSGNACMLVLSCQHLCMLAVWSLACIMPYLWCCED